jgi:hypothetical protein
MCFGGGGGGSQSVTQEFKPPEYTKPAWQAYLNAATKISQTPYVQSGMPTVAPINDWQDTAGQLAYDRALYGSPDLNAARGSAMNIAGGGMMNPYAANVQGLASGHGFNPAMQGYADMANMGANPYTSDAYMNAMIADNAQNMADAHASGTAAQNDAAAAMAGAFGGSGHTLQQQAGAANLAKQVGQMANSTRAQQQQYKGQMYNQDFANRLNALGGYSGAYMGDVANQLAANAQAGGFFGQDVQSMLAAGGLIGGLSQQDFQAMQGLQGAGNNQNAYYQALLNAANNQWNTQSQYDATMNEYLGSALGRASGSYGSTASTQPGASPWASLLGLGTAGAGLYGLLK